MADQHIEEIESGEQAPPPPSPRSIREQEVQKTERSVREWLNSLGVTDFAVEIHRKSPKTWKGHSIAGLIDTFDGEYIDEEYIQSMYGGGSYAIKVKTPNERGAKVYFQQITVKIAGDPKLDHLGIRDDGDHGARDVVEFAKQELDYERQRNQGPNQAMIEAIVAPMRQQLESAERQLETMRQELRAKDDRVLELVGKQNETNPMHEKILEHSLTGRDRAVDDTRRQYEQEMRQLREWHQRDIDRLHDQYREEIKAMRRDFERQAESLERQAEQRVETVKNSYEAQLTVARGEAERLRSDLAEVRQELRDLKSKKDKGLLDNLNEIAQLKEIGEQVGVFGGQEKPEGFWDKLPNVVEPIANRLMGGQQQQPPQLPPAGGGGQPPPAMPSSGGTPSPVPGMTYEELAQQPENKPFQAADGNMYVRQGGQVHRVEPGARRQAQKQRAARRRQQAAVRKPDEAEIQTAVSFMETAVQNGRTPEEFASSARHAVPGDVLAYIRDQGIDAFLNGAAKLSTDSPLASQQGRNFAREVARLILES